MTLFKFSRRDFEQFTVLAHPLRTYSSSSRTGVTGSVFVFPKKSDVEKDLIQSSAFVDLNHNEANINSDLKNLVEAARNPSFTSTKNNYLYKGLTSYFNKVDNLSLSQRKRKFLNIVRLIPTVTYTKNTSKKILIKDILNKTYRTSYPSAHWAYTNYNCLNFFTASSVPTSSVLLYPNIEGPSSSLHAGYVTGAYSLSGAFSFDFYIKPSYQQSFPYTDFKAGTIFHLPNSYAISLISGSAINGDGKASNFRIQLQLSHSANILPSLVPASSVYPNNLIFKSDDNSLDFNKWHHVIIRWGTDQINYGSGTFNIDGIDKGKFVIPSGTVAPRLFGQPPKVLCVGNYYQSVDDPKYFFATDPATRDGLNILDNTPGIEVPVSYSFAHPLNAEVHDLSIKRYYMYDNDIINSSSLGPKSIDRDQIAFYVPPFFVQETPFRRFVTNHGGILQTPFFEVDGTTNDPFNVALSFGVGGHYINLENFTRDFAANSFPMLHHLTGTTYNNTTELKEANEFLYQQPFITKRNLSILPCDDGNFIPSFELLVSESMSARYVDDLGVEEFSLIHLDNLISSASLLLGSTFDNQNAISTNTKFSEELIGQTPEQPGLPPGKAFLNYVSNVNRYVSSGTFEPGVANGAPLTIFQRTQDPSSNQITIFSISNLFYGKRILPGSLTIQDTNLSGSADKISITIKDDGKGNLYRANSLTKHSVWNSVGTIFYNEGIIVIKSPHLYFFGKQQYNFSFKGEHGVHVSKYSLIAPANTLNSSSNPNYVTTPVTKFVNEQDEKFVWITSINIHDENLNIVAKAQLAQPIQKRTSDQINFVIKTDY